MKTPSPASVQTFDVSADLALLPDGAKGVCLKIASPQIEINVWLLPSEAEKLNTLAGRNPELKSLSLGRSAGHDAHWSRDAHGWYYLVLGEDDETWDVGLTFSATTFEAILNALASAVR